MKNVLSFRRVATVLAASALLIVSACSTAKVKDTWVAPGVTNLNFKKILVIAASKDESTRRVAEDTVSSHIKRAQAVSSYAFFPQDTDMTNAEKISAAIKDGSFDAVIVMRMLSDKEKVTINQDIGYAGYPMGYRTFGGYYGGYAYGGGYSSTTVTTDRIIQIETNVYEVPGGKLVWSGTTESTSPSNVKQLYDDAATALGKELVNEKLIPAEAK